MPIEVKRNRFAQEHGLFPTAVNQGVDGDAGRVSRVTRGPGHAGGWIHFSGAIPGFRAKARLASGIAGIFVG